MTTPFRNIHTLPAAPAEPDQTARLPRLRWLTNDPAREYASRPGQVEKLPDAVAALILSKQGFSKVSRNGIRIEGITDKPLNFWHEDSVTIAEKAGTNEKVLWTLNRLNPDVLHILGADGEYIESIPLEGRAAWFDPEDMARELGAKRRVQNRTVERVRALHAPDSEKALEDARNNTALMKSAVHTFPAVAAGVSPANRSTRAGDTPATTNRFLPRGGQRSDKATCSTANATHARAGTFPVPKSATRDPQSAFPKADRLHEIQEHLNERRNGHAARVQTLARRVAEVTEQDLDDLTSGDPETIEIAAVTATGCAPEADDSDDIL